MAISKLNILFLISILFTLSFTQIKSDDVTISDDDVVTTLGSNESDVFKIELDKLTSKIESLEFESVLELVSLLIETFIMSLKAEDQSFEVIDKILQLMLCVLDGLHSCNHVSVLTELSIQWAPIFEMRNKSFLTFIKELLSKDISIVRAFRTSITWFDIFSFLDVSGLIRLQHFVAPTSRFFLGIVVQKQHQLLVTLLLCNAAAMEALPIYLDKIFNQVVTILLSISFCLVFWRGDSTSSMYQIWTRCWF